MDAYTGFAYVYDEYMDNIPYEEWGQYMIALLKENGVVKGKKIGRNDPCPCGSGKKYKQCCGKNA